MPDSSPPPGQTKHQEATLGGLDAGELLARALAGDDRSVGSNWIPLEPGELAMLLPQYRIEKLIGRGGMGAVYRGLQPELDRPVAIKVLPAEIATNPEFVARFKREAQTLAKLQHSRIITIHDFGQTSAGHLFFVMEYIDGTDLRSVLNGPGLSSEQALLVISQICDALHAAHRHGVIHRDIKPENVLITRDGYVKLADFGLARPADTAASSLTGTDRIMGTPAYMAPEQHTGMADPRSDVFALGIMLYEMLTGQIPRGIFDPPSQRVQVDVRIDEVVVKALQQEPERRYQQASEMKTDVDLIRTTPMQRATSAIVPQRTSSPSVRRMWIFLSVLSPMLAVLALVFWAKGRTGEPPRSPRPQVATLPPVPASSTPVPAASATLLPATLDAVEKAPAPPAASLPMAKEEGFTNLFEEAHFADWKHSGPGGLTLREGIATTWTPPGARPEFGLHWYSARKYRDFILKLDFRMESLAANSGVFVRFPDPGDNPGAVYETGSEIEIHGTGTGRGATGALWFFKPPTVAALKPNDWNQYEIKVTGNRYEVKLNGILVNDRQGDKALEGYIGLQNHADGPVQFRNLRIKELPPIKTAAAAPSNTADLRATLLAHVWNWDWVHPRPGLVPHRELRFEADGTINVAPGQIWPWWLTDSHTVHIQFRPEPFDPKIGANLVFDAGFQTYEGRSVKDETVTIIGSRKK